MTEAELAIAYEQRKPFLVAMGDWVAHVIMSEIVAQLGSKEAAKFLQIPAIPRVKETDSFLEKALVRKRQADPLKDITDQVGIRFVVLLLSDTARIGEIVSSGPWAAQKDRDFHQERLASTDMFAYSSDHYVVHTKVNVSFEGSEIPAGTPCEIQIRTLLQHAYAEMSHATAYKPSLLLREEDQRRVNRSLAKGSALIETTDDVFGEIDTKMREYDAGVTALLAQAERLYEELTGLPTVSRSVVGDLIVDTYREYLKDVSAESLKTWVASNPLIGSVLISKREESVFYREPAVLIVGLLVSRHETTLPAKWPLDLSYLQDLYTALGISTNGLF